VNIGEKFMKRIWPIIGVADVTKSADWYRRLLDSKNNHLPGSVFDQILDEDGAVLVCLHRWGDHNHPSLSNPEQGNTGKGLLLWFVVDDFDSVWERAQLLGTAIEQSPNTDNGTSMRAFVVRDPDGYYVAVNETRS
jgi:uncharacterized glyoxalase superfamily protein PhnB